MAISADMKFSDAALSWLDMRDAGTSRARYLKPRTPFCINDRSGVIVTAREISP
jgi:hypothetical protein